MRSLLAIFAAGAIACQSAPPPPEPTAPDVAENVRRLGSILDYVAADYAGSVEAGAVTNEFEYAEQLEFLDDAKGIAAELPAPKTDLDLGAEIASLREHVAGKVDGDKVSTAARALRRRLSTAYDVVVAPTAPAKLERALSSYEANCKTCHGERGDGQGDKDSLAKLKAPPRSFLDPAVMEDMTPVRVFNTLTDGVADAGMPEFSTLTPAERWDLAFYVLTMRYPQREAVRGENAAAPVIDQVASTPTQLSAVSDRELAEALAGAGIEGSVERREIIAYLRLAASYRQPDSPMELARTKLSSALTAYRAGKPELARSETTSAYLDGFEPHEAALMRHDPELVVRIEGQLQSLRAAIENREAAAQVEQRVLRLGVLTENADRLIAEKSGEQVAFVTSAIIIVREGLEAALLVLLMLGLARGAGVHEKDARAVHLGWLAALVAGIITWFAAGSVVDAIGGAQRELVEGLVAILAAVVLLTVSHYVLARLDARRRVKALKKKLEKATSTSQRRLLLGSLGFIAVYREAFETVLFLRALVLDAGVSMTAVAGGSMLGAALLIALVFLMTRVGKKLKAAPLLSALGALLCGVSVVLVGKGVRSLQEAGTLGITPLGELRIDWLGVYPTSQTILAQLAIAIAFGAIAFLAILREKKSAAEKAASKAS